MKTRMIIILIFSGFFTVFQLYLGVFRCNTISSNYKVVRIDNELEIRSYSQPTGSENKLVALLEFGGYASPRVVEFYKDKLENILFQNAILQSGYFRCLQHNSRYQIVGRRNEILVDVDAIHTQATGFDAPIL
ncbi:heme-binding protein [Dyadobacter sp. 3J3]|uniref:heme-binding protein n=1 Tax=Dyadobacter sp. 3J3 TaxID=2606600 RepID=UPI001357C8FB|nr:heme-binding protein [Dyadobacter sp. 3J3]